MRPVRSPAAPKITMMQGSPCLPIRGGAATFGFSANSAITYPLKNVRTLSSRGFFLLRGIRLHVPAEFLAHGRKHLFGEGMLLAGTKTYIKRCGQHVGGH